MKHGNSPSVAPEVKSLRWQSRRGLLELDLLLTAFWRKHGDTLTEPETTQLAQWLLLDDGELWQLVLNPPPAAQSLAEKIRPPYSSTPSTV